MAGLVLWLPSLAEENIFGFGFYIAGLFFVGFHFALKKLLVKCLVGVLLVFALYYWFSFCWGYLLNVWDHILLVWCFGDDHRVLSLVSFVCLLNGHFDGLCDWSQVLIFDVSPIFSWFSLAFCRWYVALPLNLQVLVLVVKFYCVVRNTLK